MGNKVDTVKQFEDLWPFEKLSLVEALIRGLEQSENGLLQDEKIRANRMQALLRRLLTQERASDVETVMERFSSLQPENQDKVVETLLQAIDSSIEREAQEANKRICGENNHVYGEWKHKTTTKLVDGVIDHEPVRLPVTKETWTRTCARCGKIETVTEMPEELKGKNQYQKNRRDRHKG